MKIAPQAWRFVIAGAVVDAGATAMLSSGAAGRRPSLFAAALLLSILATLFVLFCLYFFRDPERALPADGKIYSPGDGRVLSVGREGPGDVVTCRIFLSVFDVHIQRAPCAGTVTRVFYQKGSFRAAMADEAKANERSIMTIDPGNGRLPLIVEQIAGLIARRIETWPKAGQTVAAGEKYGIIYFGSQAAVHFPAGSTCTVKVGDRVAAGLTPIGEWA